MLGKLPPKSTLNIFETLLLNIINPRHKLVLLSREIDWDKLEDQLSIYYSKNGRSSVPIRKIAGLLILKHMFNESDESVVERWIENPYWQYFTGETYFQKTKPFDPSDFVHFRQRVGTKGIETIFKASIEVHHIDKMKVVAMDSTVQSKNITYPVDSKQYLKIIKKCWEIAKENNIRFRQSYKRKVKQWKLDLRFKNHPKRRKKARRALLMIKRKALLLLKELRQKLEPQVLSNYETSFALFEQVLNQKRGDTQKIYSLHESDTHCINKGKVFPKYEFGTKCNLVWELSKGIIVGAFDGRNKYDGHLIEPTLEQVERLCGSRPDEVLVDRGYKGRKKYTNTKITRPENGKTHATRYQRDKARKKMRKRAGIEPIISHLKHDHRMLKNYLKGTIGDQINMLLAGIGFNFKKKLRFLFALFAQLFTRFLKDVEKANRIVTQLNKLTSTFFA